MLILLFINKWKFKYFKLGEMIYDVFLKYDDEDDELDLVVEKVWGCGCVVCCK